MPDRLLGWGFVGVQAALLVALVLVPGGDTWPSSGVVEVIGLGLMVLGVVVMVTAATSLGRSLTPTPVPARDGELTTSGLYRFVRHPIYSGLLVLVIGLVVRTGSWTGVLLGVVTIGFFHVKAAWEEARLADRYPDYERYAARTPRFVPRPW